jgi:hypothetical protein
VDICGRELQGLTEFKATRHDVDKTGRSSTPQGKDSIDKTTRTVIDSIDDRHSIDSILWMNQTTSD